LPSFRGAGEAGESGIHNHKSLDYDACRGYGFRARR